MNSFIEELSVDAMRQKCIDVFICCAQNILKCGRGANGTKIDGSYYGRQSTLPTRPCDELGGDILGTTRVVGRNSKSCSDKQKKKSCLKKPHKSIILSTTNVVRRNNK